MRDPPDQEPAPDHHDNTCHPDQRRHREDDDTRPVELGDQPVGVGLPDRSRDEAKEVEDQGIVQRQLAKAYVNKGCRSRPARRRESRASDRRAPRR